ncbi:F-box domain protein [Pandoravirus inopinatum]|uniref:F-box domain protein n=1 Tax=Pandoravirus inopinatum TaxID=1605721 RepID=A0A0B5J8K1_9VIRU|nr:F-box domain protein [Pandoravirus inopinatum]AJF97116.1 F-box domain protein [Pandoravirus inopinatum]
MDQSETTIDALPHELLRSILVEFTDRRDRLVAWCVCRAWRTQLRVGRRYCWKQTNWRLSLTKLARRSIAKGLCDIGFWLYDVCAKKNVTELARLLPQTVSADGAHQALRRQLRDRHCRWTVDDAKRAILAGDPHAIDEAIDDGHGSDAGVLYALLATGNSALVDTRCNAGNVPIPFDGIVVEAALNGRTDIIGWVRSRTGLDHHASICKGISWAAYERNPSVIDSIEWATTDGAIKWTANDIKHFLGFDNVAVAEWIWTHQRQGAPAQDFFRSIVSQHGNVNTTLWALDHGIGDPTVIGKRSCEWFMFRGDYVWADIAVGQLDRLYAAGLIDPVPYDYTYMAHHKDTAHLAWLCEHVSEAYRDYWQNDHIWREIAMNGHPAHIALLLSKGFIISRSMLADATHFCSPSNDAIATIACVELLVNAGCALTPKSCLTLASLGAADLLRIAAHEKKVPWDARACMKAALSRDSAACRRTAAWIGQEIGVDVGAFEQDLLRGT